LLRPGQILLVLAFLESVDEFGNGDASGNGAFSGDSPSAASCFNVVAEAGQVADPLDPDEPVRRVLACRKVVADPALIVAPAGSRSGELRLRGAVRADRGVARLAERKVFSDGGRRLLMHCRDQ